MTRRLAKAALVAADSAVLAAALGVLAATAAALAAGAWWGFELFTHFRLQYVAAQIPLCIALAALRRPRWCALVALAAIPNLVPILPYLAPGDRAIEPARASATAADALRIVSVNVKWDNRSTERLFAAIEAESPDAIVVVEMTDEWQERLRPIFSAYPHRLMVPTADAFGIGLLSRYPLEAARVIRLETTPAIDARVAAPHGSLRLIGLHLRPPMDASQAAERGRQLDALAEIAGDADEPLAICGDFNLTPYSPEFTRFTARTGLRDARAQAGLGFTWPSFLPLLGIPIDHCVVSPEVGVARFRRLPAFGSDHYPIAVELFTEDEG